MIVATRAPERDTHDSGAYHVGHLGELFVAAARDRLIPRIAAHGTEAVEAGRDEGLVFAGGDLIAGQLFLNKTIVRLIVVEGTNHVIAVAPGIGTEIVVLETLGLGEPDNVQPVLAPVLSVMFARQQAIDNLLPGFGRSVIYECGNFGRRGWKTREIERDAADQRRPVGRGSVRELFLPHTGEHKGVDRGLRPSLIGGRGEYGNGRMSARQERPVLALGGSIFPERRDGARGSGQQERCRGSGED